jgi:hypothetical protein
MKILLAIIAVLLVAASIYADYKWRQWMAARKSQLYGPAAGDPARRRDHE